MSLRNEIIGPRESEFTGLKGFILRCTGTTYALILLSLFIKALTFGIGASLAAPLNVLSLIVLVLAFATIPLRRYWRRQQEGFAS